MRRSLVLCDDTAHHPFRASLPRHVARQTVVQPKPRRWLAGAFTAKDWREFLMAYCAGFMAFMVFLA